MKTLSELGSSSWSWYRTRINPGEITEMDCGAGYIRRKWSVHCRTLHCLRGPEYRLWLKDHLAIYAVKNAVLAPGYAPPREGHNQ